MKKRLTFMAIAVVLISVIGCSAKSNETVEQQLADAAENRETVLLVLGDNSTSSEETAKLAKSSTKEMDNVRVIEMNRDDEVNAALIKKHYLEDLPLPNILIFSDRGILFSGLTQYEITSEAIKDEIPTKAYSEVSYYISKSKAAIINVTKKGFASDAASRKVCEEAEKELAGSAVHFVVGLEGEADLLQHIDVTSEPTDAVIVVINNEGITSARFDTTPTKEQIMEAANKKFF